MERNSYKDIIEHYEKCFELYGDTHRGVDWPNLEDVHTRYRIMLDIIKFNFERYNNRDISILDFGCGLGHFYEYILENKLDISYTGLDISKMFIEQCQKKFPNTDFILMDILKNKEDLQLKFDYIILNGVFTEKRNLSYNEMFNYFKEMIKKVYSLCNYGIAFNVMSKDVDWEREDLFHLPLNELSSFLTKEISRDFIVRYDYGLYEYTVYLYKRLNKKNINI